MILDNEIVDIELGRLCEFLEIIDAKLDEINQSILKSSDPDSDGLFDKGEYYIGIGFVTIQHHLNESLISLDIEKYDAFFLGSKHPSGEPSIRVVNCAANWWKHEAEWWKKEKEKSNHQEKCFENTIYAEKQAFKIIMNISKQDQYALSDVLASFSKTKELSFIRNVIPHVEEWTKLLCNDLINKNVSLGH